MSGTADKTNMVGKELIIGMKNNKKLKKTILVLGDSTTHPVLNARCQIKLTDVSIHCLAGDDKYKKSFFFDKKFNGHFIFGKSSHFVDMDFEKCIQTMNELEKSCVSITYFNNEYLPALIVTCIVDVIEFQRSPVFFEWTWQKKIQRAKEFKAAGVLVMKDRNILEGFVQFSKAAKIIITVGPSDLEQMSDADKEDLDSDKVKLFNNMALCQLHFCEFLPVVVLCSKALEIDKDNIKSLYRRASAYMGLKDWVPAYKDMTRVLELDPTVREARDKMPLLQQKVDEVNSAYKSTIKNMFTN